MVALLQSYKRTLYYDVVNWKPPEMGWIKCNIDGASEQRKFTPKFLWFLHQKPHWSTTLCRSANYMSDYQHGCRINGQQLADYILMLR
ncbi:hypothetical protein H5410_031922 [Solanum commersonii]|uniref:Uncharacterized protein n=1 Tax=Solanum commersonii TaxID=4109 RepID=A0A9J5YLJ2_SOLCO|nr:hypothetical protein H5410_031922 [Solanum commersonii]